MFKHPAFNAIAAAVYIIVIVSIINLLGKGEGPDNVLAPIALLSMFTLSAAVMAYLFVLQPIQMYLDGKKKEAVAYFTQTIGIFAIITAVSLVLVMLVKF